MPLLTIADLLAALLREPGRPRITWYGPDGERVELSGAVLSNWVSKSTNLLVEEYDAGPGSVVLLDLPPHWRTVVWALAAWRAGACVTTGSQPGHDGHDVVVTDRPGAHAGTRGLVAVALPALARRFDGDLPAGAVDAAAAVMTYGDVIAWSPAVEPGAPALVGVSPDGPAVPHADLLARAARAADAGAGARALLQVPDDRARTRAALLAALGVLHGAGSVVLLGGDADDSRVARITADERVTATLGDHAAAGPPAGTDD